MLLRLHTSGKRIMAAAFLLMTAGVWAQKPDTPPTPAIMPVSQGVAPFDMTGFIQFASVDSVCTRNDNV